MLKMRQPAQWIVVVLFVAWISFGNWHALRSSVQPPHDQTISTGYQGAKQSPKEIAQSESIDDRLARYTLWLAIFTGALVLTSVVQNYFLIRADKTARLAANAAANSVQIAKESLERAYVFGGCGDQQFFPPATMVVNATHGNYGKTPGFVEWIFIEHCLERDLPIKPHYTNRISVSDPLPPTGQVKRINNTRVEFDVANGQIYYGRIVYLDVFKSR